MNSAGIRERLQSGGRVYGTMVTSPSPLFLKACADTGLDFAFFDMEHIPLDRSAVAWMCAAYDAAGFPPLVRVPSRDAQDACIAVDAGAWGVVFPYVETPEEVRALVGAVKHRPLKGKRLADRMALSSQHSDEYIRTHNRDRIAVANIESAAALDALDEICAVDGLDWLLVGPHDLSVNLGIPEQYTQPEFLAAIDRIIQTGRDHGLAVGYHKGYGGAGLEQFVEWGKAGLNVIIHEADVLFFHEGLAKDLSWLRRELGDGRDGRDGSDGSDGRTGARDAPEGDITI